MIIALLFCILLDRSELRLKMWWHIHNLALTMLVWLYVTRYLFAICQ